MFATTPTTPQAASARSFWTGGSVSFLLAIALLAVTAYQSLATFFIRIYDSDVMLGAVGNLDLVSRASLEIATFVLGLVAIHALFAIAVQALAFLTARALPSAARSRHGLVVLWFALLLAAVLLQNAEWFPRSHSGSYYHSVAVSRIGPFTVARVATTLVSGLAVLVLLATAFRIGWLRTIRATRFRVAAITGIAVLLGTIAILVDFGTTRAAPSSTQPNVVIIGIDSLRLENLARFGGSGVTSNIDALLRDADVFPDTITPLARTFPSWMSILTGRAPRSTNATFNLVYRPSVRSEPTLASTLSARGYTTYYATDEVRFSNIDRSYGFDQVITPPIGAADFLIGRTADLPLSNVVANSPLGAVLLDYLHGNRAVATLYRPETFLSRVRNEFSPRGPVFLAIHLTSAHWPYYHADTPLPSADQGSTGVADVYLESLRTADVMVGDVMRSLQSKGVLDHAIVVILSDHGEALMGPGDALVSETLDGRVKGLREPARVLNWGHGQSVLSPVQFQVLLAFRGFGPAAAKLTGGRDIPYPASLEDVLPTVLDLLDQPVPTIDGESLAPWLADNGRVPLEARSRIRFTETDIRVAPSADGTIDEDQVAAEAAQLFEVDPNTGWLHLRPAVLPTLMHFKERAALDDRHLLAAMPVAPGRHQYLLLDRISGEGTVLAGRPDETETRFVRLWDALQAHFPGELHPPIIVGEGEQPLLDAQWAASTIRSPASSPDT